VISSTFVLSAASASDFPRTGLPEISMVGRSNVGKSSLINALVKKTVARTSAAPGKTRLANYYLIESRIPGPQSRQSSFYLVDLPGYGYARGGQESAQAFEALTTEYFTIAPDSHRRLAGVLHLIDARHPDLAQDISAHGWVIETGLPRAIIATKMDKLKRADTSRTLKSLRDAYDTVVLPESALDRTGLDEIWKTLRGWLRP
jgi:GTP-binding protein